MSVSNACCPSQASVSLRCHEHASARLGLALFPTKKTVAWRPPPLCIARSMIFTSSLAVARFRSPFKRDNTHRCDEPAAFRSQPTGREDASRSTADHGKRQMFSSSTTRSAVRWARNAGIDEHEGRAGGKRSESEGSWGSRGVYRGLSATIDDAAT